jgi:arylsulfatase A-like enzyme
MKPNILFLVVDGLRADKCYGIKKSSFTPNIDKLIENGTYFEQTISSGQSTIPSVSSIFTSLHPFESLVPDGNLFKINPNIITYVDKLQDEGYKTFAIVQDTLTHLGFQHIFGENLVTYDHVAKKLWSGLGNEILENLDFIKKREPWFCYMQFYDLNLLIYSEEERLEKGPEELKNNKYGKNLYERIISAQDKWVGKIIKQVDLKNTLVILTSDHGLESGAYDDELQKFNDEQKIRKNISPGNALKIGLKLKNVIPFRKKIADKYKNYVQTTKEKKQKPELQNLEKQNLSPYKKRLMQLSVWQTSHVFDDRMHVPLVLCGYNSPKEKIVHKLTRSIDIFPTIFDFCNLSNLTNRRGKSLRPLMLEENFDELTAFVESTVNLTKSADSNLIGLRTFEFKYFRNRSDAQKDIHLYDLQNDPLEENNIYLRHPEIIKKFESELIEIDKNKKFLMTQFTNEIDSQEAENIEKKLKDAGYIN